MFRATQKASSECCSAAAWNSRRFALQRESPAASSESRFICVAAIGQSRQTTPLAGNTKVSLKVSAALVQRCPCSERRSAALRAARAASLAAACSRMRCAAAAASSSAAAAASDASVAPATRGSAASPPPFSSTRSAAGCSCSGESACTGSAVLSDSAVHRRQCGHSTSSTVLPSSRM